MPDEVMKAGRLTRELHVADIKVTRAEDGKASLTFSASSEHPVERWFGTEILSHEPNAVRLERARQGVMPMLFGHNPDDPIGMIDAARIEDKRLVVDAHLFDTARGQEVGRMIDGGLRAVSIGYRLNVIEEDRKNETYTATDWEPFEVSIVAVPADPTVGIGRSEPSGTEFEVRVVRASTTPATPAVHIKETSMEKTQEQLAAEQQAEAAKQKAREEQRALMEKAEREAREELAKETAVDLEKKRIAAIRNLAQINKVPDSVVERWIADATDLQKVSEDILAIAEERGKTNPQPASRLGLSDKDTKKYSLGRAILACYNQDWSRAGFEAECSQAVAQKLGRDLDGKTFLVPFDVLSRAVEPEYVDQRSLPGRRDLTVASAGGGGYLVATENQGFIEILRNRSVAFQMGAMRLSGLQGNITVPRHSAAATAYWLSSESTQITESQQTFVQMTLQPKTAGAYTEISRLLLLQSSPAAESIVTNDLAAVVALAADLGVLDGSGSAGQPTGIMNTSGIGSTTATSVDYSKLLDFQEDLATANVMPSRGGYVTTPAVAKILASKFINSTGGETPLWAGNLWDGQVAGFKAMSSNQMPSGEMLFGDWNEVVVGEWGVLEINVNPFANFQAGIIGVRAIYSMDVGVRRPFAFSHSSSVTA